MPARPVERLPEVILGHRRGSGCALQQKQLAFDAQQLGNRPAFFAVLVKAYAGNGVRERQLSAGGIGPLNKPLKEDDPLACVRSALTSAGNGRR